MPDLELIPINEDDFKKMALPVDFDRSRVKNRVEDVQYGTLPEQKLDLYLPEKAEGPLPLIIYVHGGGWTLGTKTLGALDCIIDAVDYGYAVMSVDYRLAPAVSFPEYIFDVKTAVRWARAHAEQYGLDKDRFAMIGDSAGGHITLTVGFTAGRPEYEGAEYGWAEESSAVQVICDMYGPAVLWADADKWYSETKVHRMKTLTPPGEPEPPTMEELAFGGANKNLLKLISPISLVHKDIPPHHDPAGGRGLRGPLLQLHPAGGADRAGLRPRAGPSGPLPGPQPQRQGLYDQGKLPGGPGLLRQVSEMTEMGEKA